MKVAQVRGMKVSLLFSLSLIPLLQSIPSFTAQMDVETQTDLMPLGPPPERYQEWSDLQELFDNAVIDEVWSAEEFEQAVMEGTAFRANCIDAHGILHLLEVESADLANLVEFLPRHIAILEGFRFKNALVDNYSLEELTHTILFRFCSFKETNFEKPEVECMSFEMNYMSLKNCDLRKTKFSNTGNLSFSGCLMQETSFRDYNRIREFAHCNLRNATFFGDFKFNCRECDLYHSSFAGSRFPFRADFDGCDLSYSSFDGTIFYDGAHFNGCNLSNSSFRGSTFKWFSNFDGCNLSYSSFKGSTFRVGYSFNGCDLSNSSFEGSMSYSWTLWEAHFKSCNLSNSSFKGSAFRAGIYLNHCLFENTNFEQAAMSRVEIEGNIPHNASFSGAHIAGSPVLQNCTVKLPGSRYFDPDSDPFPGAFLLTYQVELRDCKDALRNPIPDCNIRRAPYFKNLAWARNKQSQDHYYFE